MGLTRVTGNIIGLGVSVSGIVTATDFQKADGSPIAGGGLGTAISESNEIYFVDNILGIGATVTVTVPDTTGNNLAYTQYPEIAVDGDADLIISEGDELLLDVLGISTDSVAPRSGSGGRVRADNFTDNAGTGAPTFNAGLQITGVATATSFSGNLTGNVTGQISGIQTSITVGNTFIKTNQIGIGSITTAARNAGINTVAGTLIFNATDEVLQLYNGVNWENIGAQFLQATGGTVNDYQLGNAVYRSHTFTNSQAFQVNEAPANAKVDALIVAGGGGGGCDRGGGGGGGGYRIVQNQSVSVGSYPVIVGSGGVGSVYVSANPGTRATLGGDSIFNGVASSGGGEGGGQVAGGPLDGDAGGSGGGGGAASGSSGAGGAGNTPAHTPPQGNAGGAGRGNPNPDNSGGGGGGAGGVGNPGTSTGDGGPGGAGASNNFRTGSGQLYAGGGGGGSFGPSVGNSGAGGPGGGGAGSGSSLATAGEVSTGGGGGGGGQTDGYPGGPGIVVIRYQIRSLGTAKATGGDITFTGTKTIHTFTGSGTFTVPGPGGLSSVDFLAVGGGGGGGGSTNTVGGGGGGAGGVHYQTGHSVTAQAYTITVGGGGIGGQPVYPGSAGDRGDTGGDTTAFGFTAGGGGGGGSYPGSIPGGPGASSGGTTWNQGTEVAATGSTNHPGGTDVVSAPGQGFGQPGGGNPGSPSNSQGGGAGGGASTAGAPRNPGAGGGVGGVGGAGAGYTISGTTITYAGGGGGGGSSSPADNGAGGAGGNGGGGAGGLGDPTGGNAGGAGASNLGSGGGGASGSHGGSPQYSYLNGGNGGSGIVIISYPT